MNLDPSELERAARRMRAEAVSRWLVDLSNVIRAAGHDVVGFIRAFRALPGVRA